MLINAVARLQAARADQDAAVRLLTELGFTGLVLKSDAEDIMQFKYKTWTRDVLESYLGSPKDAATGLRYTFGDVGVVAVFESQHRVILKNSKRKVQLSPKGPAKPADTPVPEPKAQEPRTGTLNDDQKVPHLEIPDDLVAAIKRAATNRSLQLPVLRKLWHFFNRTKFGGRLEEPNLRLLKNVKGTSLRTRGHWRRSTRELALSPRLFLAHQDFLNEVLVHEMCHQAVAEIDNKVDPNNGHGPLWIKWMRHCGLNPLRFDPKENSEYMNEAEKEQYQQVKDGVATFKDEVRQLGLNPTFAAPMKPVTFMDAKFQPTDGLAVCKAKSNKWAILPFAYLDTFASVDAMNHRDTISWQVVDQRLIYSGRRQIQNREVAQALVDRITNHYEGKRAERKMRSLDRKFNRLMDFR